MKDLNSEQGELPLNEEHQENDIKEDFKKESKQMHVHTRMYPGTGTRRRKSVAKRRGEGN